MAKRIQQRVNINGETKWISGSTQQELFEAYLAQALKAGIVALPCHQEKRTSTTPTFGSYLTHFVDTYKSRQERLTVRNRQHVIRKHILPRWGQTPMDEIRTADIQQWFDELCDQNYARETILKIRHIISPVFDSAVEDEIIARNPLKSRRLTINTQKGGHHQAIPPDKMKEVRASLHQLPQREQRMAALLCYTGMRLEEVLGLRWEDIDPVAKEIHIQRAVIHPTRNQPEVKEPKTKTSKRTIPLPQQLAVVLGLMEANGFVLGGDKPLTYQQQKRAFDHVRKTFGLEHYSAHDFRDTCATEWQESGMPLSTISRLLGHASSAITERCYVKFRDAALHHARDLMEQNPCDVAEDVAAP